MHCAPAYSSLPSLPGRGGGNDLPVVLVSPLELLHGLLDGLKRIDVLVRIEFQGVSGEKRGKTQDFLLP